jgi:transcriptional regulator with XRE-family HTH domain
MHVFSELRKAANFTQERLAQEIGQDRSTVAKWEAGAAYPRSQHLQRIASILGVTEGDVISAITAVKEKLPRKDVQP